MQFTTNQAYQGHNQQGVLDVKTRDETDIVPSYPDPVGFTLSGEIWLVGLHVSRQIRLVLITATTSVRQSAAADTSSSST